MKRKRIYTITAALLVSVFTFLPVRTGQYMVAASEAYQKVDSSSGVITANEVNLRTGPATTFDILCKLKKDQKVTVMGKLGDWYAVYVGANGNVGSVSSRYLKLDKAKTTTGTKQVATQNNSGKSTAATTAKNSQSGSKAAATGSADKAKAPAENTSSKATVSEKPINISSDEQALFDAVNKARKEEGLKALQFDAQLVTVARLKAKDMKDNNYFSHTSKYYGTPFDMMKKYGIKFSTAGENIAGNQSIDKVVKAWLKENGNNIYNDKFTHTGIGIVDSPTYGKLFVQMFIKK